MNLRLIHDKRHVVVNTHTNIHTIVHTCLPAPPTNHHGICIRHIVSPITAAYIHSTLNIASQHYIHRTNERTHRMLSSRAWGECLYSTAPCTSFESEEGSKGEVGRRVTWVEG